MKRRINKKTLILLSLLLLLPLFSGCFLFPSTNHAPTITSSSITTATVDVLYTYDVEATDPDDGDTLTHSLTTHPTGMTIDSTTGVISWTPTSDQIGDHNVTVEVSDGELNDSQNFIIVVSEAPPAPPPPTPTNHAPTITSTPDTLATVDVLYTYDVNATDSDGDTLTYSLTTNPTGMTIDSGTGEISWTPITSQIGDHDVTVEVSDGEKSTTQSFTITVHDVLDHIVVLPETMTLFEGGETETIASITAHYNNGDTANLALGDCTYGSDNESVATVAVGVVTTVDPGTATITVTYIEGGITQTDTVVVTVDAIVLTSIVVLPDAMNLFEGGKTESINTIIAHYNNGDTASIALDDPNCTYGSDNESVATVAVGVVTTVDPGTATITVTYIEGGITQTDTVVVTVDAIVLTSIVVLPDAMNLFEGGKTESINTITAHYNNGDTASIALDDPNCTYGSDNESVATVAVGVVTTVDPGTATITVTYIEGGITQTDTVVVTVDAIVLDHIVVLPETMDLFITVIGAGETETIASITAHYNNGDTAPIALDNPNCTYGSNNESVATVAVGVVTAVGAGTAIITVTYTEGGILKEDTVEVTVDSANLELTPSTQSVDVGNPVTINILVEDVTELLGGNITLNFDAIKLQCILCIPGSFFAPGFAFVIPTIDNVSGSVILALTTLGEQPSGTGNIVTITFNTVATGVADITFGTTILRDKNNDDIVHTSGSGCSVTIN